MTSIAELETHRRQWQRDREDLERITWCGQQVYGGCSGNGCERNCSGRAFTEVEDIVSRRAAPSRAERIVIISLIIAVGICGAILGNRALDREARAYFIERV